MDYSKFNFPAYVYHEFPKWIETAKGSIIVHSAEEELRVLESKVEAVAERIKRTYTRKDK